MEAEFSIGWQPINFRPPEAKLIKREKSERILLYRERVENFQAIFTGEVLNPEERASLVESY